mmetsp:Transcript_5930/g.11210  ORF Transcript_5930/g.11210 Transcript_5930/m.11210 type:complete len:93 (-) Transcript_5930:1680-1958(-)
MLRLLSAISTIAILANVVTGFAPMINRNQYTKNQGLQAITLDGQEIRGEITPLGNFVLVRTKDTLAATSGGVLLPDQVSLHGHMVRDIFDCQ